jgi:hypothetical protein
MVVAIHNVQQKRKRQVEDIEEGSEWMGRLVCLNLNTGAPVSLTLVSVKLYWTILNL